MNKKTPLSDEWETPQWLFDALDSEFGFTLDGAANESNAKCKAFCCEGKPLNWAGERVFCNPPYSMILPFLQHAPETEVAVFVLPVRTDTRWFQFLQTLNCELRFFRKRVAFLQKGVEEGSPRFASLIAIVRPR
jgi:phage N-6-adenine-methyltransferase